MGIKCVLMVSTPHSLFQLSPGTLSYLPPNIMSSICIHMFVCLTRWVKLVIPICTQTQGHPMGMATLLKKSNSPSTCHHQLGNSSLASGWDLRKPSLLLLTGLILLRPWVVTIATYKFMCTIAMSRLDHSTLQYSSPSFQILFYFCPIFCIVHYKAISIYL